MGDVTLLRKAVLDRLSAEAESFGMEVLLYEATPSIACFIAWPADRMTDTARARPWSAPWCLRLLTSTNGVPLRRAPDGSDALIVAINMTGSLREVAERLLRRWALVARAVRIWSIRRDEAREPRGSLPFVRRAAERAP